MNGLLNASNKLLKKASTLYTVNNATTTGYIRRRSAPSAPPRSPGPEQLTDEQAERGPVAGPLYASGTGYALRRRRTRPGATPTTTITTLLTRNQSPRRGMPA